MHYIILPFSIVVQFCASSRCVQSCRGSWAQATLTVKQLFVTRFSAQFAGPAFRTPSQLHDRVP